MVLAVSQTSCGSFIGCGGRVRRSLWSSSRICHRTSSRMSSAKSSWLTGPACQASQSASCLPSSVGLWLPSMRPAASHTIWFSRLVKCSSSLRVQMGAGSIGPFCRLLCVVETSGAGGLSYFAWFSSSYRTLSCLAACARSSWFVVMFPLVGLGFA